VAEEQAAALGRTSQEDEEHRREDLQEVAEKEAEAVPEGHQTPDVSRRPSVIPAA